MSYTDEGESLAALAAEGVALFLIISVAAVGNSVVMAFVWKDHRMHTPRNILLTSSIMADLLLSYLVMLPNFISLCSSRWIFGDVACQATALLSAVLAKVTILTISSVVFEKFQFLRTKQFPYLTRRLLTFIVMLVWSVPSLFGVVYIFLLDQVDLDGSRDRCLFVFLDAHHFDAVLLVCIEAALFVCFPLFLLAFCFWQMFRNSLSFGAALEIPDVVHQNVRWKMCYERRRSVRSLVLFSAITLVLVYPFLFAQLAHDVFLDKGLDGLPISAQTATVCVFWSQCAAKPVIYLFNNEKSYRFVQRQFQRLCNLCSGPKVHHLEVHFLPCSDGRATIVSRTQHERSSSSRWKYEPDTNEGDERQKRKNSLENDGRVSSRNDRSRELQGPFRHHAWSLPDAARPSWSSFQVDVLASE